MQPAVNTTVRTDTHAQQFPTDLLFFQLTTFLFRGLARESTPYGIHERLDCTETAHFLIPHSIDLNGNLTLDGWVGVVFLESEVLLLEGEDVVSRFQYEYRTATSIARQLFIDLIQMVQINVAVTARPDELTDRHVRHRRHHVRQHGIAGDVERNAQEEVSALVFD